MISVYVCSECKLVSFFSPCGVNYCMTDSMTSRNHVKYFLIQFVCVCVSQRECVDIV